MVTNTQTKNRTPSNLATKFTTLFSIFSTPHIELKFIAENAKINKE